MITLAHALEEGPRKLPVTLVQPGSFLTLHYRLAGPDGADVVNTFGDKPATLTLGTVSYTHLTLPTNREG